MLTHRNQVVNTIQMRRWMTGLEEGKERIVGALPFFHVYGMTVEMSLAIYLGSELIILPDPRDVVHILTTIQRKSATVVPGVPRSPVYWRVNGPERQVLYSQYHLSTATERAYLADLERRALPSWFQGYPSFLTLVAEAALRHGVRLRPRRVTTGAETLLPHQRRVIREAFGVEPRQHYGQAEAVANISECPAGRLHVDEDFAAIELPSRGGRQLPHRGDVVRQRRLPVDPLRHGRPCAA